jgi:hypothetical protein
MEKVAHGVDEDSSRLTPTKRLLEPILMRLHDTRPVDTSLRVPGGIVIAITLPIEPPGHHHGVAVVTTARYAGAPGCRIPGSVRPLDTGIGSHGPTLTCALYVLKQTTTLRDHIPVMLKAIAVTKNQAFFAVPLGDRN